MIGTALVADADPGGSEVLLGLLRKLGVRARGAPGVAAALSAHAAEPVDVVLLDAAGLGSGLPEAVSGFGDVPVIAFGAGGVQPAVEAIRAGAADYLEKPVEEAALRVALGKVLGVEAAEEGAPPSPTLDTGLLGTSRAMQQVLDVVRRVAASSATLLVRGESGTGKELVARAIHRESPRVAGPFVKVHCAGLPETLLESELFGYEKGAFTGATARKPGRVEIAEGGTLFLDEIGDISPAMQVKLLRLLQDREYERLGSSATLRADVRFIAATHRDLEHMIKRNEFREDLFYRLNVVPIWLPPLRARKRDVALLAVHFCETFAKVHGRKVTLSEAAVALLSSQRWPGNVRQLQNFIERLVLLAEGSAIEPGDVQRELAPPAALGTQATPGTMASLSLSLPSLSKASPDATAGGAVQPLDEVLRVAERAAIERALRHAKGNRTLAARLLGVGRATLYKKLDELGMGSS